MVDLITWKRQLVPPLSTILSQLFRGDMTLLWVNVE